jgi:hypothetical protein
VSRCPGALARGTRDAGDKALSGLIETAATLPARKFEHNLAKVGVVGSNPIARSRFSIFRCCHAW